MANELAAVAGDIKQLDDQLAEMSARRARLVEVHNALEDVGRVLGAVGLTSAMAPVRVHRGYGGRGYLVDWLQATLKAAAPEALDTISISRMAEEQLGLVFPTEKERQRFVGNSLSRALRKLGDLGLVERTNARHPGAGQGGRWRWKTGPTLPASPAADEGAR